MALFKKAREGQAQAGTSPKKSVPAGLWTKCPECTNVMFSKSLRENLSVCTKCGYHFVIGAWDHIGNLTDKRSFRETHRNLRTLDPLKFKGPKTYLEKFKQDSKRTGLKEACVVGECTLNGQKICIGATDSRFIMGSMGSVVGEKITCLTEDALKKKVPLVIVSGSGGGARMYEGALSLMQMAKTSASLMRFSKARLPFISILTNPTMGGVMASFAALGDIILAEPGALIGFAGPRVIEQTIRQKLPEDFQTAEFLLDHGMVDKVVPRSELKSTVSLFLNYFDN